MDIYTWIVSINGNTYDSISTTGYSTPSFTLTNTDNLADSTYTISLIVGDLMIVIVLTLLITSL